MCVKNTAQTLSNSVKKKDYYKKNSNFTEIFFKNLELKKYCKIKLVSRFFSVVKTDSLNGLVCKFKDPTLKIS
jgi:hypothetical protein